MFFGTYYYIAGDVSSGACTNYCLHHGPSDPLDNQSSIGQLKSTCHITSLGHPVCHCQVGYGGSRCEINKCNNFCLNSGVCSFTVDGPVCECGSGYIGTRCQIEIER